MGIHPNLLFLYHNSIRNLFMPVDRETHFRFHEFIFRGALIFGYQGPTG